LLFVVYQTKNLINGKIYIGTHITKNPEDRYLGSGLHLQRALKKYGTENFEKKVLYIFDNADDMFKKEADIVNEDFLKRTDVYNLKLGGEGGWDYINANGLSPNIGFMDFSGQKNGMYGKHHSEETKLKISDSKKGKNSGPKNHFFGKTHTEETRQKISSNLIGKTKGRPKSEEHKQKMRDAWARRKQRLIS